MTLWTAPAPGPIVHHGKHRRPARHVDEERIPTVYLADVTRLMRDGRGIDEAMLLAGIDADDALAAWRAAS